MAKDKDDDNEFDPSKDVTLLDVGTVKVNDKKSLEIAVKAYNGGDPKLALTYVHLGKDGEKRRPARRLPLAEAVEVIKLLGKAETKLVKLLDGKA